MFLYNVYLVFTFEAFEQRVALFFS